MQVISGHHWEFCLHKKFMETIRPSILGPTKIYQEKDKSDLPMIIFKEKE